VDEQASLHGIARNSLKRDKPYMSLMCQLNYSPPWLASKENFTRLG